MVPFVWESESEDNLETNLSRLCSTFRESDFINLEKMSLRTFFPSCSVEEDLLGVEEEEEEESESIFEIISESSC